MTAKEFLGRAQWLEARIDAKFERIERLREMAARRTAIYGQAIPGGGASHDRISDAVARIMDEERRLDEMIDEMLKVKREVRETIAAVPDARMRTLLELRYLNGCKWREIAKRLHYSYENIQRLHSAALRKVAAVLENLTIE